MEPSTSHPSIGSIFIWIDIEYFAEIDNVLCIIVPVCIYRLYFILRDTLRDRLRDKANQFPLCVSVCVSVCVSKLTNKP